MKYGSCIFIELESDLYYIFRGILIGLSRRTNTTLHDCISILEGMRETNPLLGVRGCRFSIVNPEFLNMQIHAALSAGLEVIQVSNKPMGSIQFLVPMISSEHETLALVSMIKSTAEEFFEEKVYPVDEHQCEILNKKLH